MVESQKTKSQKHPLIYDRCRELTYEVKHPQTKTPAEVISWNTETSDVTAKSTEARKNNFRVMAGLLF